MELIVKSISLLNLNDNEKLNLSDIFLVILTLIFYKTEIIF